MVSDAEGLKLHLSTLERIRYEIRVELMLNNKKSDGYRTEPFELPLSIESENERRSSVTTGTDQLKGKEVKVQKSHEVSNGIVWK